MLDPVSAEAKYCIGSTPEDEARVGRVLLARRELGELAEDHDVHGGGEDGDEDRPGDAEERLLVAHRRRARRAGTGLAEVPQLGDVEVRPAPRRADHDEAVDPVFAVRASRRRRRRRRDLELALAHQGDASQRRGPRPFTPPVAAGGAPAADRRAEGPRALRRRRPSARRLDSGERERGPARRRDELEAGRRRRPDVRQADRPPEKPPSVARPTTAISPTRTVLRGRLVQARQVRAPERPAQVRRHDDRPLDGWRLELHRAPLQSVRP